MAMSANFPITLREQQCEGVSQTRIATPNGNTVCVEALVVDFKPLGFCFLMGMNGIVALGGVPISATRDIYFMGKNEACLLGLRSDMPKDVSDMNIIAQDFTASFEKENREWIIAWKWNGKPETLVNKIAEHTIPIGIKHDYEKEIEGWIEKKWLQKYEAKKHGPIKGLVPLMVVVQRNKGKVRPVLDFRELNTFIEAFTTNTDACADKLRDWRQFGENVSIIDLSSAYMQLKIDEKLWAYQTVMFRGQRFCLTRLGFGLNVAPAIMRAVLEKILSQDENIWEGTSSHIDDILVNEDVVSARSVLNHLEMYGLHCKPVIRVSEGARILGLQVGIENKKLFWRRDNNFGEISSSLTRRKIFSLCGKMTGNLPVCGWLRVASSFIKRTANDLTKTWDEKIQCDYVEKMVNNMVKRTRNDDPAKGVWNVYGNEATVWVGASSLALGVIAEVDGNIIEDACWLRKDNTTHLNMSERDAVIKGLNMGLKWKMNILHICTDSKAVFYWVTDALTGKSRLRTKASKEMLIRRRLQTITNIVDKYKLRVDIKLVPSEFNLADTLTECLEVG